MASKKYKIKELIAINASLAYLSSKECDEWMKVARNMKKVKPALEGFEESRQEIVEKYAIKDKDGKAVVNDAQEFDFGDEREKADKAFEDLMNEEVSVEFIKIKAKEVLKDGKPVALNAVNIEPLIDVVLNG